MSEENNSPTPATDNSPENFGKGMSPAARKAALSLFPLSPAPLTGKDAFYGWVRLGVYGGLTYATWGRARKVGYIFAGAAAASLISSITAGAWQNAEGQNNGEA